MLRIDGLGRRISDILQAPENDKKNQLLNTFFFQSLSQLIVNDYCIPNAPKRMIMMLIGKWQIDFYFR